MFSQESGIWGGGEGEESVIIIYLGFVPVIISKIKWGIGQLFIKGFSTEQFCDVLFFECFMSESEEHFILERSPIWMIICLTWGKLPFREKKQSDSITLSKIVRVFFFKKVKV